MERRKFLALSLVLSGLPLGAQTNLTPPLFTRNPWRASVGKLATQVLYRPKGGKLTPLTTPELISKLATRLWNIRNTTWKPEFAHSAGLGLRIGTEVTNEEGYLWAKLARMFGFAQLEMSGENAHRASAQALENTLGYPAAPNHWSELGQAQTLVVIGSGLTNPYPLYQMPNLPKQKWWLSSEAVPTKLGGQVLALRPHTELALLGGWIRYLLTEKRWDESFVRNATNASYQLDAEFNFKDGRFTGLDPLTHRYRPEQWRYEVTDPTSGIPVQSADLLSDGTVLQLLQKIYTPYTPANVSRVTGIAEKTLTRFYEQITQTSARPLAIAYSLSPAENPVFTEQWLRALGIIQLLTGQVGQLGTGLIHLAGGWNPQGLMDVGANGSFWPGYSGRVMATDETYVSWVRTHGTQTLQKLQGVLATWYGAQARETYDWGFHWLPRRPLLFLHQAVAQGQTRLLISLNSNLHDWQLDKVETLVLLTTNGKAAVPEKFKGELFILPIAANEARHGTITDLGRRIIAQTALTTATASEPLRLADILWQELIVQLRQKPAPDSDQLLRVVWPDSSPEQVLQEMALGVVVAAPVTNLDVTAPIDARTPSNGRGVPIYEGLWMTQNLSLNQDVTDTGGLGLFSTYGWSWPANIRVLGNRASADASGSPRFAERPFITWDEKKRLWQGPDRPDIRVTASPGTNEGDQFFRQTTEGVGKLIAVNNEVGLNLDTGMPFRHIPTLYLGAAPVFYWPWGTKQPNPFYPQTPVPPVAPV